MKQICVIERGPIIQSFTKVFKDRRSRRKVLDLSENSEVEDIARVKNQKSYEQKKKRIEELLKFIEEELEE